MILNGETMSKCRIGVSRVRRDKGTGGAEEDVQSRKVKQIQVIAWLERQPEL